MKILLSGGFCHMELDNGWGKAARGMYYELKKTGFDIQLVSRFGEYFQDYDEDIDIEISYKYPKHFKFFSETSYKIAITPWDSSDVPQIIKQEFAQADEIWGSSFWTSSIYEKNNVHKNIFTYRHGLSDYYTPKKHVHNNGKPFTFLHIGEPSARKGGKLVVDCFIELFGNDPNYELILKCYQNSEIMVSDPDFGVISGPPYDFYQNIKYVPDAVSLEELILFFNLADVFVYPSYGEGFGYTPLEAICLGVPTICVPDWADYAKYITVPLKSNLEDSPDWFHPGKVFMPDKNHLKELMLKARDEHEKWADVAFKNASLAYEEFKWETTTKPAVERLKNIQISRNL
jgi:glycosyltransferase involved in cell wall biosynthesis